MRQREERDIDIRRIKVRRRRNKRRVGQTEQVSMDFADTLSGVLIRRYERDLDIRMEEQYAK
jgi:hypothetical protein